jgi:hypothetical protein
LLSVADLQDLLHQPGISNQNRLLLCLATDPSKAHPLTEVRDVAAKAGWKTNGTNLSVYLGRAKGLAILTPDGWQLTTAGKDHVAHIAKLPAKKAASPAATSLRAHVAKLKDANTRAFIEEAVSCLENSLFRSAVVLSWVGAISVLYDHVMANKLAEFNVEATKRNQKWKTAKKKDDLALMGEYDLLQVLHAISVIGKNVKDELEGCLKLRNGCGHPNSLKIADTRVAAHIETLLLNVFDQF